MRSIFVVLVVGSSIGAELAAQHFAPVEPLLTAHCADCHDADASKGGLDLAARAAAEPVARLLTVSAMRDRVTAGEMPPPDHDVPLAAADRATLLAFCDDVLAREVPRLRAAPGRVTVRRLSRTAWENSVRDLFGVVVPAAAAFPADDLGYGFDSIGDALSFSTLHLDTYLAAAGEVAAEVFHGERADAPAVRRVQAERMRALAGDNVNLDGEVAHLLSRVTIGTDVVVPRDGVYRLRVRVAADPAGDEPAQLALGLDGRELCVIDVPDRRLRTEDTTLPMTRGTHRVALTFVNDHYDPAHPDPARRDRNLRIDWLEVVGPLDARPELPQQAWLRAADVPAAPPGERARAIAAALLPRAWRRPVAPAEAERVAAVADAALARGEPFHEAVRRSLQAALASPHFLFRVEPAAAPDADAPAHGAANELAGDLPGDLPGWALAVRLSFFVWSSMPDDALRAAAAAGELATADGLRAQLARLLADPRADALATDFGTQWLALRALGECMPDPAAFPCDGPLLASMRRETELLVRAVLREGHDVRTLVTAGFTHVDRRLAAFYGLEVPELAAAPPDSFVRVELPAALRERGGVLGHASVLTLTSNPTRTSPVKRGKWVLENLLGQAPPPPPPGNDALANEAAARTPKGLREQLAAHRRDATCASCHRRMDALGFALERFDGIGRARATDEHGAIDDRGELPDGRTLAGIAGLGAAVAGDPALPRTIARKLFVYGVGRDLGPVDRLQLDLAVDTLRARGTVTLADLVGLVVASDAFRRRGS